MQYVIAWFWNTLCCHEREECSEDNVADLVSNSSFQHEGLDKFSLNRLIIVWYCKVVF